MGFTHVHVHSDFSALDGLSTPTQIVERAVELGCDAVALSDHGECGGHIEFWDAAKKAGIKPILGMEAYVVDDSSIKDKDHKKNFHLTLWAQNRTGLENLWALSTMAYIDGFYSKPRLDWAMLEAHAEGLVCGSACLNGHIAHNIREGDFEQARFYARYLKTIFPGRFFLELHTNTEDDQNRVNVGLVKLSHEENIPVTFACDSHYSRSEDYEVHEALIGIQTKHQFSDPKRWTWNPCYHMMDEVEVRKSLAYLGEETVEASIVGSGQIADLIDDDLSFDQTLKMPHIEPPEWFLGTHAEYLTHLCRTCLKTKVFGYEVVGVKDGRLVTSTTPVKEARSTDISRYVERLEFELDFIIKHGLTEYFMVVSDYTMWARAHMLVGPARGSAGGSLACYLAGITTIDPLRYNLPFERFLNEGRLDSLPDIDLDFPQEERVLVKQYIEQKHGADKVASIGTISRFKAAGALKDACSFLGVSFADANKMSKLFETIPNVEGLKTWDDFVSAVPDQSTLQQMITERVKIFDLASHLFGVARQTSEHAAGLIVSPVPLASFLPLRRKKDSITTQFDGDTVIRLGFLKADILGLRTLSTLQEVLNLVEQRHGVKIDLNRLTDEQMADPKMWKMLCDGKTLGIFQCETPGITGVIKRMQPNKVEDLAVAVGIYRPGVLNAGMLPVYQKRRNGDERISYIDPRLEPILSETFGVCIYQEQVMEMSRTLAGYSPVEADNMRSILGKKKHDKMKAEREKFVAGCVEHGMEEATADSLFADVQGFASYSFNKSHALAYGMISLWCAYLKANYPAEMMCALMNTDPKKVDRYIKECHLLGIKVRAPHVNTSQDTFSIDDEGTIVFGLQGIKFLGSPGSLSIKAGRPYSSLEEFFEKNPAGVVNKRNIEALIKLGAFEGLMLDGSELGTQSLLYMFTQRGKKKNSKNDVPSKWSIVPIETTDDDAIVFPVSEEFTDEERSVFEQELMGTNISYDPISPWFKKYADCIVTEADISVALYGSSFFVLGTIKRVKQIMTKKDNQMAFIEIENHIGEMIEFTAFSKQFAEHQYRMVEGNIVLVYVKKAINETNGEDTLLLETMKICGED